VGVFVFKERNNMAIIKVVVPEAFALDENGRQLSRLTVKYARNEADMQPELAVFAEKWNATICLCCGVDDTTGMFGQCSECPKGFEAFAVHSI
jgi:hypothetical protein